MADETGGKYAILPEFSKFPALPVRNSLWMLRLLSLLIAAQRLLHRWKPGIRIVRHTVRTGQGHPVPMIEVSAAGSADPSPALIYCHGGAFFMTYAAIHLDNAQHIARETGCKVFVVDYRLSTSAPFPAQFDDCMACLRRVVERAEEMGVDPARIGVMGDSAGGALAAGLAQRAKDEGIPLRAQILLYPVTDASCSSPSAQAFTDTPLWTAGANRIMWDIYLRGGPTDGFHGELGIGAYTPAMVMRPGLHAGLGYSTRAGYDVMGRCGVQSTTRDTGALRCDVSGAVPLNEQVSLGVGGALVDSERRVDFDARASVIVRFGR